MRYNFKVSHKILLGAFVFGSLLTGCQNSDNDLFDADPIVRLDNIAKAELKAKLVDSENGWIVNWSPDGNFRLGGFNTWMQFNDDNSLLLRTDLNLSDLGVEKSEYNFVKLNTLALSFPLGNKIHEFTSISPSKLRSDIEFLFSKYNEDGSIEFKGHMTRQKIVLRKASADEKKFDFSAQWATYAKLESIRRCSVSVVGSNSTNYRYSTETNLRSAIIGSSSQGFLTDNEKGEITYVVSEDGNTVYVIPSMILKDGSEVSQLIAAGDNFVGVSETGSVVNLLK